MHGVSQSHTCPLVPIHILTHTLSPLQAINIREQLSVDGSVSRIPSPLSHVLNPLLPLNGIPGRLRGHAEPHGRVCATLGLTTTYLHSTRLIGPD